MSEIQSIIFDKETFTKNQALDWIKKHHFHPLKDVHTTKNFHRIRISDPNRYKSFYMKPIAKNYDKIKFVIGVL